MTHFWCRYDPDLGYILHLGASWMNILDLIRTYSSYKIELGAINRARMYYSRRRGERKRHEKEFLLVY